MTESEKNTERCFQKIFLPQYTFGPVDIREGNKCRELCDCLIETSNCYVVIQIKERNKSCSSSDGQSTWFQNKVLRIAMKQTKRAISDLENENISFYSNGIEIIIDRTKDILPVIVFYNDYLVNYDKLYYSKTLNRSINIFNRVDYQTMLDTVKVPIDIVSYLKCRINLISKDGGKRLIVDDSLIALCKSEEEFAKYYLKRTYYDHDISLKKIVLFNEILADLSKSFNHKRNALIETLLMLNTPEIVKVTEIYAKIVENIYNPKIAKPKLLSNGKEGIVFIRHPNGMPDTEFKNFLYDMCAYYTYVAKLEVCNAIIFEPSGNEHFIIKGAVSKCNHSEYNDDLEVVKIVDSVLWEAEY